MVDMQDNQTPGHSISLRVTALALLFRTLAWLFSYPSKEQVQAVASEQFLEECRSLLQVAAVKDDGLHEATARFEELLESTDRQNITSFCAEYTRLFISPPLRISLEGSSWVKNRTSLSQAKGERHTVSQIYRDLGLKSQNNVKDPADHLVSELDYLSYVASAEARAWEGGDIASAREWRKLGREFMARHLMDMAHGVVSEVREVSDNTIALYCVALLGAVVNSGFYAVETDFVAFRHDEG